MGVSQSSTSSSFSYAPAANEPEPKQIRPYGLAKNSRHIQLNSSYSTLYEGIISLVQNNKYADLLIICGDDRYPVHRAVVCPRSHFFDEQCTVREGENDFASPSKPTKIWIDPSECDSHIVAAVLTFLYTLDYSASGPQALKFGLPEEITEEEADIAILRGSEEFDSEEEPSLVGEHGVESVAAFASDSGKLTPPWSSTHSSGATDVTSDPGEPRNELVFHVQMYCAGHRFGITSLCDIAKEKLNKRLQSGPWNVEMIHCIREIYRQGSDARFARVKEVIMKSARSRFRALKACEGFDDLVTEFPDFAVEILRRL